MRFFEIMLAVYLLDNKYTQMEQVETWLTKQYFQMKDQTSIVQMKPKFLRLYQIYKDLEKEKIKIFQDLI